jgi:predicted nuclease of predicted toxin-antitoxin system
MQFLADENTDHFIVRWLRELGYDVFWAAEDAVSASDDLLLAKAQTEKRILITKDKGFGEMVFRQHLVSAGIILLRLKSPLQEGRLRVVQRHWPALKDKIPGRFSVVTEGMIRVRELR